MSETVVTVSFKRMVSLPGYQNMEAHVAMTRPIIALNDEFVSGKTEEYLQSVTAVVLKHLQEQVKAIYANNGGLAEHDYRHLLRCVLGTPEELKDAGPMPEEPLPF